MDDISFEQVNVTFQEENSSFQQMAALSGYSRNIQHSCIILIPRSTTIQTGFRLKDYTQNRCLTGMNVEGNGINVNVKEST